MCESEFLQKILLSDNSSSGSKNVNKLYNLRLMLSHLLVLSQCLLACGFQLPFLSSARVGWWHTVLRAVVKMVFEDTKLSVYLSSIISV
jgi:hypothetical protein